MFIFVGKFKFNEISSVKNTFQLKRIVFLMKKDSVCLLCIFNTNYSNMTDNNATSRYVMFEKKHKILQVQIVPNKGYEKYWYIEKVYEKFEVGFNNDRYDDEFYLADDEFFKILTISKKHCEIV